MNAGRQHRLLRTAVAVTCLGIFALLWFSGALGSLLVRGVGRFLLPVRLGDEGVLTAVGFEVEPELPGQGVAVVISSDRLRRVLREASVFSVLVPPGVVRDGFICRGAWFPEDRKEGNDLSIPVVFMVDDGIGDRPLLYGRYPAREFNNLGRDELAHKLTREKDWVLGHYDLTYRPTFYTLSVRSIDDPPEQPVRNRRLAVSCTGKVRFIFEDNLADARATARVRKLDGTLDFRAFRDHEGVGFIYSADIDVLDANVHNMAPWADEKISKELRRSWERSLNRRRRRKRFARKRIPAWVPLDTRIDLELLPLER